MSDFECVPVGTLARLAATEAERDSLREILSHIPSIEAELAETSDKLRAVEAERDALLEALKLARSIIGHPDDAHSQMIDAAIRARSNQ